MEQVILVNERDEPVGLMEKMEAHEKGILHRAFSVFIFNSRNELLLQQRALTKYHSAGLWTNTCCSHPRSGEETLAAAHRRLKEEMGIEVPLSYKTQFIYKSEFDNGLTEHELDHVFVGHTDANPVINSEEVHSYSWRNLGELKDEIRSSPEHFTSWFRIALDKIF